MHLPGEERKKHEEYMASVRPPPGKKEGVNASPAVPQTSTGFIGWRSAPEYQFAMNDVHHTKHYQGDLLKTLKWPREATI